MPTTNAASGRRSARTRAIKIARTPQAKPCNLKEIPVAHMRLVDLLLRTKLHPVSALKGASNCRSVEME